MSIVFKSPFANSWSLFRLVAVPMNVFMLLAMLSYDLSDPTDISHMIAYSVRWSVPFIYLVVAASALPVLFPGEFSRWCLRNRKYIGLLFAVAMAWQGLFIFMTSSLHTEYYYDEVYLLRNEIEGSSGYLLLAAMVVTSFQVGRQFLSNMQWKVLHRSGMYFLWAYPFAVYWWNVFYYDGPDLIDHLFYIAGFAAFALRIAAWGKRRTQVFEKQGVRMSTTAEKALGIGIITAALVASATGKLWLEPVYYTLMAPGFSESLALWLPFWPFEPFLPLLVAGLGTWIYTGTLRNPNRVVLVSPGDAASTRQ
ncbi:MAG: hypothetical protein AAF660_08015 [Pseudomonadota bacterium]